MRTKTKLTISEAETERVERRASKPSAMADDDDDDFFGDFKFASKPHAFSTTTSTTAAVAVDVKPSADAGDSFSDDDWGDFVTTRADQINGGFELPNGAKVGGESEVVTRAESAPSWRKPSGALPLSLFGEAEEDEEEKSGAGESRVGDGEPIFFDKKDDDDGKKMKGGSSLNGGVGIGDLIANLYGPSEKINAQNGSNANSNVDGPRSNANTLNWNQNGFDFMFQDANLSSSKLDSGISGLNFNSNGLSSDLVEQSEGSDDEDEDDGWEFQGAVEGKQEQRAVEAPGPVTGKDKEIQVDSGQRVKIEELKPTIEFSNDLDGSFDMSIRIKDASNSDWSFGYDFNPSSVSQDDHFWDSYSRSKKQNDTEIGINISSVVVNGNSNGNFWQFEDAFSGTGVEPKSEVAKVYAPADLGGKAVNDDGAHGPTNVFALSEGSFHRPQVWDFAFSFGPSSASEECIITHVTTKTKTNDTGDEVRTSPDDNHVEFEDNIWEFKDAFSETGSKNEGESVVAPSSSANMIPSASDGANQANEIKSDSHREALPLSLFGDEEPETTASTIHQDVSIHTPASYTRTSYNASGSNLSINDLLSSLYGQAEQSNSEHDLQGESENGLPSTIRALESDPVYPVDDFDDDSWEFKDASGGAKEQNQSFVTDFEASPTKSSTKLQLNDFVDFYCKLKDESCVVALSHFENLKKAQSSGSAPLPCEDFEEVQKAYDQFCRNNMISELQLENLSSRSACLGELLKVLQEPKFRVLESEYQLSNLLSLAEKDLGSAVELSKHATSTLRILKLGSAEEQSTYVSTWFKIVSVSSRELKHGASIWKHALQINVQSQILSEPQGRQYIIALGEIYRVVQVLGASVKLYKPWVLLDSEGPLGLFALINECTTLWSTSGLDEALENISEPIDSELGGILTELLDSIKYIHNLDVLALHDHVFSGKQPLCRLSMLTPEIVPGMKVAVWDGDQYMLKLANLWANLISSIPPDLPRLNIG